MSMALVSHVVLLANMSGPSLVALMKGHVTVAQHVLVLLGVVKQVDTHL